MRMLSFDELKPVKGIPYHRDSIRRLVKLGLFPKPVKLAPGPTAPNMWPEDEIDAYLKARVAERDAAS